MSLRKTLATIARRSVFGLVFFAFWQYSADRLISSFWISSPEAIVTHLWGITRSGELLIHVHVTLYEMFWGYIVGALIGIAMGVALATMGQLADAIEPYIVAFYGIPRIALAPLLIIWFGIGLLSKVVLVALVVMFLTFFSTFAGLKNVSTNLRDVFRVMGANSMQILVMVSLPAATPWILSGLRMSIPYALVGAIVGEFVASSQGLGYLLQLYTSYFRTTGAMAIIVVLALIVIVLNAALSAMEGYLLRWRPKERVQQVGSV